MLKNLVKVFVAILIIFIFSVVSFFLGYHFYLTGERLPYTNSSTTPVVISEAMMQVKNKYYSPVNKKKLIDGAITGIVDSLGNPFASYLDTKTFNSFQTHMSGNYSGVGMGLDGKKGQVKVLTVFDNSPAQKAGLKANDLIINVNNKSTKDLTSEAVAVLIKGKSGTKVTITIKRKGETKVFAMRRKTIEFPNAISRMEKGNVGYVRLHSFTDNASDEVSREIKKQLKKGAKKIIFDLRSNPGGELIEAVNVTSLFLKDGLVLKTQDKSKNEKTYNATGGFVYGGPLIVLVDENSASASEIVSGALKDHNRATLVGTRTFGKGTVQEVTMLSNGGAILIPTQYWLTPNGTNISKKGILPDVVVKDVKQQLPEALDLASSK